MSGIEVNPKQENLWNTAVPKTAMANRRFGIGNLVRIPYSPLAHPGRMCMLERGDPLSLAQWLPKALASRPLPSDLARLASPQERSYGPLGGSPGQGGSGGFHQEAWDIWKGDRPIGNGERDNQFYTLAKLMKGNGLIYSDACQQIIDIYYKKVLDSTGFSVEDALSKVRREYGR